MKCPKCGHENPPEDLYCGACGSPLSPGIGEEERWVKTYGIPGLYEASVSDGPGGAEVQTRLSLLGFSETSTYPRWMITSMMWFVFGLTLFLGLLIISEASKADRLNLVWLGLGVIGIDLLVAYVLHRVYYRPPRHCI